MTIHWLITPQILAEGGDMQMWCGARVLTAPKGDRIATDVHYVTCERCMDHAQRAYVQLREIFEGGEAP